MDYVIDSKDFVEYESEIILSGCIREFFVPTVYRENGNIYWVYHHSSDLASDLYSYTEEDLKEIIRKSKSYMLNPENIVLKPGLIFGEPGNWKYHYIPTGRKLLYDADDFKRFLMLERYSVRNSGKNAGRNFAQNFGRNPESHSAHQEAASSEKIHILYNPKTRQIHPLTLKKTIIGSRDDCNLHIDFGGELVIDRNGELSVRRGEVRVNRELLHPRREIRLESGDKIKIGKTEIIYW